ncbi:PAS domain-containing protein [Hymenobacter swuensis]|uniref:histidine kinase n=1 Tax=Hymenobacter swuensis DY53 TaxID=1227739 RepID=W8F0S1_9BACT|nr:PAS domain-containing protein [Hymenobacter swuensis]AHJ97627.1 histidine kinase [Hymenobacter swuensis DY53]
MTDYAALLPVFNALPGANLLLTPQLLIEAASNDYLAATLTQREQLVGFSIFEAFPDHPASYQALSAVQELQASLQQVLATGQPHTMLPQRYDVPNPHAPSLSVERYWQPRNLPIPDEQGQIRHILHTVTDVTEQVQERGNFYQIFEHTPAAICIQRGPEHRYEYVNCAYEAFFPGRQLLGRTVAEALPETVEAGIVALLDRVYQTGETYFGHELPLMVAQPDGHPPRQMYFTFTYQTYRENGAIVGISTFAYDVAEQVLLRQSAEQERATALAAVRRQAEEREMFYQVFEQTPALVQLLRQPGHRIAYVNPAYQALFPGHQLVGRDLAEALPELATQGFVTLLNNVYQTGETYVGAEVPLTLAATATYPAGTHYFNFTYQAYREHGQIAGVSVFAYNVTEQVLARRQREAERLRLHKVFAQAPVAICVFEGPDYVLDVVNQPMSQMLGRPLPQLLGQPFFEAMPELADQGLRLLLDEVRRTGVPFVAREQEIRLARHQPHEAGLFDFVYQPLRDEYNKVSAVICVATEVTTQAAARRVVEQREESFRLMADNAPAMLWVTDADGYCTYLNQPWYAFTGQTEAEALGMGWVSAVHPEDAPAAGRAFMEANAHRIPFHCLYRLRRHDGQYRWAIDSGQPRFTQDGEFAGIVGTVIDVHEQKLAELALQRLTLKLRSSRDQAQALNTELQATNGQLMRTNVDLDNFIYTASHDLKAPITNIEGLLYMLRDELPLGGQATEAAHLMGMMQDSVERFKRTIEHLTDVSRLQQEHDQPVTEVVLREVIEDVQLDLTPLRQQVGGQVELDIESCSTIIFSPKNLRSVVYNLLSNAFKYHHPDRAPQVRISCRTEGSYQILEVQDNGLGIEPGREDQLFAMFQRLHTHVEGSGIGLYMVKRMVENVGGKITVQSQPGEGSVFAVYFKR